jgi:hypothetical protein
MTKQDQSEHNLFKKDVTMINFITRTFGILSLLFFVSTITLAQKQVSEVIRVAAVYTNPPNSADGVDLNINWENLSKKTIKYITFGVDPYNAVDDAVACDITGHIRVYCKSTGPHAPGSEETATWENTWYNNTIVRAQIEEVTIIWMDGTTKDFSKKEIRALRKQYSE